MVDINNIFEESQQVIWQRLSTILIFTFIYYQLGYYILLKNNAKCDNLPQLNTIIFILVFHIIQVIVLFNLLNEEKYFYMWLVSITPLLIYVLYRNYMKNKQREEAQKLQYMLYQLQSNQKPEPLFHQDTSTTGIQNQLLKNGMDPLKVPPQNLSHNQMKNIIDSKNVPGYGDYISQYNSNNDQYILSETLDPYKKQFSQFTKF